MSRNIIAFAVVLALGLTAAAQSASTITGPAPGTSLSSSSTTFTWNAGPTGTTGYGLNVGSTGVGSANLINIGPLQGTSVIVKFPVNYATIYVRLWTESAGCGGTCYVFNDYTYLGTLADPLTGVSCAVLSATTATCTATLASAAPMGGVTVLLASSSSAVTVPTSVTVPGGSTTASFPATINPVTITAQAGGVAETATINLSEAYQVALNWNPPATSPDPVAGYDVFRATGGSTAFAQINTALVTGTAFIDATVADEATYDYIVESVDASGVKSVPSNMAAVLVP